MTKKHLFSIFALAGFSMCQAEEQTLCPIMVEDEIDEEEVVEFEGQTIYMCCGSCVKAWDTNPKYYLKVARG